MVRAHVHGFSIVLIAVRRYQRHKQQQQRCRSYRWQSATRHLSYDAMKEAARWEYLYEEEEIEKEHERSATVRRQRPWSVCFGEGW